MNQHDEIKFAEIMTTVGEVFAPLTDKQLDIYFDCLKEYDIDDIAYAAKHIMRTQHFIGKPPSIADFVQAIETKNGSPADRAELAWTALIWAIENVGHPASVQFDDPIIHDVVRVMGGWLRVCSADGDIANEEWHTKNLQWRRKDFISLHKNLAHQAGRSLPYLVGLQEAENSGKYDNYIPRITRITGRPGQYQSLPGIRPKELEEPKDPVDKIIDGLIERLDF